MQIVVSSVNSHSRVFEGLDFHMVEALCANISACVTVINTKLPAP